MSAAADFEIKAVTRAALLGTDYRGVKLESLCKPGDRVQAGDAVLRDIRRPQIVLTAPVGGEIARIERGSRRRLLSLQIQVDSEMAPRQFQPAVSIREFMLQTGIWGALRTRPFDNVPDPETRPAALLITCMDTQPGAPSVAAIVGRYPDEFKAAAGALIDLADAPLYLCHAPDYRPAIEPISGLHGVSFSGGEAASLPGRHINALCPIGFGSGEVWHLGYQDVIALGHLLLHGTPWQQRIISLSGSAVRNPRSLCVVPGASVNEILAGEFGEGTMRIRMGSASFGRPLRPTQPFLQAGQRQLTVDTRVDAAEAHDTRLTYAVLPSERLDELAPPGIYAVPLMRALQLGDAERARELGALELVEEDLAPLGNACLSGNDYGVLLRQVLDQLEGTRA